LDRLVDHLWQAREVLPVHDGVDREWYVALAHSSRRLALQALSALVARDSITRGVLHILETNLHVINTGLNQRVGARIAEQDAGGDQIAVEPGTCGMGDQILEIAACHRL